MANHDRIDEGVGVFGPLGLRLYDPLVMGLLAAHVWACPPGRFVAHYRRHLTANHLELGPGTGYCLDRCGFPVPRPRLVLVDRSTACLRRSARRLGRFAPECIVHDLRTPGLRAERPFDSIALGGVLHCLPGDLRRKCRMLDAIASLTARGTAVFGYTLVADAIGDRCRSRLVHRALERLRIVDCRHDTVDGLRTELARRYASTRVELAGCFAFFSARVFHPSEEMHP